MFLYAAFIYILDIACLYACTVFHQYGGEIFCTGRAVNSFEITIFYKLWNETTMINVGV